jgi:NAD(P)-dependent dehydrogenase (short-subunit alcohol dehydrogenase family)
MGEGIAPPIWVATDGASLEKCEELSRQLQAEGRNIDLLVCNAWPSLTPLWIDPASCSRIVDYVALGTSLVAVPLSVFVKNMAPAGKIVVVSSSAVTQAPANWPHYVAAKCAVEGLTRVASLEYRDNSFAIVRPPRLATDMTDLPSGHLGALSPVKVASKVLDWLAGPGRPGSVEVIDQF